MKNMAFVLMLVACNSGQNTSESTGEATGGITATGGAAATGGTSATGGTAATTGTCSDGVYVTTDHVSYGYYEAADGLYKCQNFVYSSAKTVCIYKMVQWQSSLDNLCANLSPISTCTFTWSETSSTGQIVSTTKETEIYLTSAWSDELDALKAGCAGTWVD